MNGNDPCATEGHTDALNEPLFVTFVTAATRSHLLNLGCAIV